MSNQFIDAYDSFENCVPEATLDAVKTYCSRIAFDWEMTSEFVEHDINRTNSTKSLINVSLNLLNRLMIELKAVNSHLHNCLIGASLIEDLSDLINALAYVDEDKFGISNFHPYFYGLRLAIENLYSKLDQFTSSTEVNEAYKGDSK